MRDPFERIHTIKLALIAVSLSFAGFALMATSVWFVDDDKLSNFVFGVGDALLIAAAIGIVIDHLLSKSDDERNDARLDRLLKANVSAFRESVIKGFAFDSEDLARVATPDMLDRITKNSLALRLGDPEFAEEVYEDVRDQAITAEERWHDAKISVRLSMDTNESTARVPAYIATIRWEYTTVPKHAVRRFAVVSDREDYRELVSEPGAMSAWFFRPQGGIDAGSTEAFELAQLSVDGELRTIKRSTRRRGQMFTAAIGKDLVDAGQPVAIAYTYRVMLFQHGHLLHLDMEQPTRNVDIELDYGDTNIDYVNVLDFFVSSHKTTIEHMPPTVPERSVHVSHDGWVMQRSGVAFVWVCGPTKSNHDL